MPEQQQLELVKQGGRLPSKLFRCKRCHGGFRALWVARLQDWFLICDSCEVGTIAPRSWHDWIEDTLRQFSSTRLKVL